MTRMNSYGVTAVVAFLALAMPTFAEDATPPGPGEEWQQEDWTATSPGPGRNRSLRFGSGMGQPGSMFGPEHFQQRMQEMRDRVFGMQSQFQDMQRLVEESKINAIRQNLGVNDTQWARINPRLDRIERFKAETNAAIEPGSMGTGSSFVSDGGSSGGGWSGGFATFGGTGQPGQSWSRTETFGPGGSRTVRSGASEPTQAEILCEELHGLLQASDTPPAQIAKKVTALRQAKQRAQNQLQRERAQLRSLVNPRQEAALIVMGYLD